jgi:prepilin-type N-terminal cleavage/methylation domain-containing protein
MRKSVGGFTIIELLIVIVVIGVLAAITIVAFNGIQNRANDSAVISDLGSIKKKIEAYKFDNGELYPNGSSGGNSSLAPLEFKATKSAYATSPTTESNLWYCRNATQSQYSVIALSKSGKIFYITQTLGPTEYTGGEAWSTTAHNCNTKINSSLGWQYQGYLSTDTTNGPWRGWAGGN